MEKSNFDKISFNQDVKVIRTYQIQQLQLFQCHLHRCSLLNYPWMLYDIWIDAVCNCYFFPRVYESLTGHESFFCNTLGIDSIILVTCKLITFILWWIISYLFNWISNCWCSLFISSSSTVWCVERGSDRRYSSGGLVCIELATTCHMSVAFLNPYQTISLTTTASS